MEPEEERLLGARGREEAHAVLGDGPGAVHLGGERRLLPGLAVAVEALGVAVADRDVRVVDDGGGRVARGLEDAGEGRVEVQEHGCVLL